MIPLIAIPVLHSSGVWIASTSAAGYMASTLSTTWVGAFIAGNVGLLSGLGITSAAGAFAALGGTLSSAGTAVGAGLTAVGLSGLAQSLGLAPATFLGLTFLTWTAVTSVLLIFSSSFFIYFFAREKLKLINSERNKGGLPNITWHEILKEVKNYEKEAMLNILEDISEEYKDVKLQREIETVDIRNVPYKVRDLKYVVDKNGSEEIVKSSFIPYLSKVVYRVKIGCLVNRT